MSAWHNEAGLTNEHVAVKPQSVWVRYDLWHSTNRAKAIREPMIAFLNAADDAFRAARSHALIPEPITSPSQGGPGHDSPTDPVVAASVDTTTA